MKAADRLDRLRAIYLMQIAEARQAESGAIEIGRQIETWPHGLRLLVYPAMQRLREHGKLLRFRALRADRSMAAILKKRPELVGAARSPAP